MKLKKVNLDEISSYIKQENIPGKRALVADVDDEYKVYLELQEINFPMHKHPYDQLFIVLEEEMEVSTETETVVLGKGDSLLVPKGLAHRITAKVLPVLMTYESKRQSWTFLEKRE